MAREEHPLGPLSPLLTEDRDLRLAEAARLAGARGALGADKIQALYDASLAEDVRGPDRIKAIGYAFGQLMVQRGGLTWATVHDPYGGEPVVAESALQRFCAPLVMIGQRLRRGERVDLDKLCSDTIAVIKSGGA